MPSKTTQTTEVSDKVIKIPPYLRLGKRQPVVKWTSNIFEFVFWWIRAVPLNILAWPFVVFRVKWGEAPQYDCDIDTNNIM